MRHLKIADACRMASNLEHAMGQAVAWTALASFTCLPKLMAVDVDDAEPISSSSMPVIICVEADQELFIQ